MFRNFIQTVFFFSKSLKVAIVKWDCNLQVPPYEHVQKKIVLIIISSIKIPPIIDELLKCNTF